MKFHQILSLILFFVLVLVSGASRATVEDGTIITKETLAPLADWVTQETGVAIHALPITTASGHRLKTALGLKGVQQARAAAAYLPGQIVINNVIWDPDSLVAQSYIVHELVHHTQLISRKQYPCHAAKEREAYMLQNQWLAEQGQEPIVTQEWIDKISSCGAGNEYDAD
jgi:hypothetical protein